MVAEKLHPRADDAVWNVADLHVHIEPAHPQFAVRPFDLFDHRIGRAAQDDAFVNRLLDRPGAQVLDSADKLLVLWVSAAPIRLQLFIRP